MKKTFVFILMLVVSEVVSAQEIKQETESNSTNPDRVSLTVGVLQGGGGLVGADFEALLSNRVGIQVGAGLISYGFALNYHFKPGIRSSFLSLNYWNQGVSGNTFIQSMIGPSYVFRAKKWFTAQIGLGYVLDRGPAFPEKFTKTPVVLMYSIGAYFVL